MNELARLGRIVELARDPRVRIEELQQCIADEPGLATEVVRIAGSELYGMAGRIHSLTRALLILGAQDVGGIAALSLVRRQLRAPGDALWFHSLGIAVGSQLVSRWLGLGLDSEAFLAGLLHELRGSPPGPAAPLDALLSATHAILADAPPDSLAGLDLYPDDEAALRSEIGVRTKLLAALV